MIDYELIDSGDGRRLERFGRYIINRPDPEALWSKNLSLEKWQSADANYVRTHNDKGHWIIKKDFPQKWYVKHDGLTLTLKLSPFKHVGLFPEQEFEWNLIKKLTIEHKQKLKLQPNILNLFAYTGVASLTALAAGAKITHVDASRPAITWFKENQEASGLLDKPARVIIDDCLKFTAREAKRQVKYDGVIMDPPVYGHGPNGEHWSFSKDFPKLLDNTVDILSDNPAFVIINAYAVSTSPTTIANMLREKLSKFGGTVTHGELTLNESSTNRTLSTGIYSIWTSS